MTRFSNMQRPFMWRKTFTFHPRGVLVGVRTYQTCRGRSGTATMAMAMAAHGLLIVTPSPPLPRASWSGLKPAGCNLALLQRRIAINLKGTRRRQQAVVVAGFLPVDPWAPNTDQQSVASSLFAASLFPYLGFLYHLTKSKTAPKLTLFGFYFLLAFVGATSNVTLSSSTSIHLRWFRLCHGLISRRFLQSVQNAFEVFEHNAVG